MGVYETTLGILYGSGSGEHPAVRYAHTTPAVTLVSGYAARWTIVLAPNEGSKVNPGDTLSVRTSTPASATAVYVTSVSTDTITVVSAFDGSPIPTTGTMAAATLHQNPTVTDWTVHKNIDTVFASLLWPTIWKVAQYTPTWSPSAQRAEIASTAREIVLSGELVGGHFEAVDAALVRNLPTAVSSTGSALFYRDTPSSATHYVAAKEALVRGDETTRPALETMVAIGAAALCLGASIADTAATATRTQRSALAPVLWADFLQLRQQYNADLLADLNREVVVYR